jgi:hypothetical protein
LAPALNLDHRGAASYPSFSFLQFSTATSHGFEDLYKVA